MEAQQDVAERQTWYSVTRWRNAIEPVTVVRLTPHSLWVESSEGRSKPQVTRRSRSGTYESFFPTIEEARLHILSRLEARVRRAEKDLGDAKSEVGNYWKKLEEEARNT
jgi:hypothetical protein